MSALASRASSFSARAVSLAGRRPAAAPGRALATAVSAELPASTRPKLNKLGDSDLVVSECCLGTMTWGQQNTDEEAYEQLTYAFDNGVNFLDTAEMYPVPTDAETQGRTDLAIAKWLKDQQREKIILASKVCGASERITWVRDDGSNPRVDRKNIVESVDKSLKRLGTDYIDLLQIHWPDRYVGGMFGATAYDASMEREAVPFEEQLEAMGELVTAGKVRYIGVSNETSYGVSEFARIANSSSLPKIVSIQNSYSLLVRGSFETDLAETCAPRNHNVGLLAYSPLAGGSLTGKYRNATPEGSRFTIFPGFMDRYNASLAKEAVAEYCKVAEEFGMTPSQMAIIFCADRWFCTSTIIGATSMDHLKENIDAFNYTLPEGCLEAIAEVYKKYRDPSTSP